MKFNDLLGKLANRADVSQAQAAIRTIHGKGSSGWLAAEAEISQRTARRWLSDSPPPSRIAIIIAMAPAVHRAAQVMRGSTRVSAGRVYVAYDDADEGHRFIGEVDVDFGPIADALENGSIEFAQEKFSASVLEEYGPGLGDTLFVYEWDDELDVH